MTPYRVGLVGCGGRGRQLARYVAGVAGMQLVAAADLTVERRELARAELGEIAVYPDHIAMMREARLDIALLGTTGPLHAAITRDLCAMGIGGIYCEKPMACSLADAEQIIADCAASSTIFMMGHQRRWMPEICGLRDALRSGIIGRVTHGSMFWATGRVGSNGTHFFDALNFILDSQPVEVVGRLVHGLDTTRVDEHPGFAARLANDPGGIGFITYASGVRMAFDFMSDVLLPYTYTFCGTRGWLTVCEIDWEVDLRVRDADTRSLTQSWIAPRRTPFSLPHGPVGLAEQDAYRELMACIAAGTQPRSSGEDGRVALETIVAFHRSSAAGMQPVALPLPADAAGQALVIH